MTRTTGHDIPDADLIRFWREHCDQRHINKKKELEKGVEIGHIDRRRIENIAYRNPPPQYLNDREKEVLLNSMRVQTIEAIRNDILTFISKPERKALSAYRHLKFDIAAILQLTPDSQRNFHDRCTNSRGRYLIFRLDNPSRYLNVAFMRVKKSSDGDPLATFTTVNRASQAQDPDDDRTVQGVMYANGERVTSFGQLRGTSQIRVANIQMQSRNTRTDMVGVRLGLDTIENRARAYRMYCYQLIRPRSPNTVKSLVGEYSLESERGEFLSNEIPDFRKIITYLARGEEAVG